MGVFAEWAWYFNDDLKKWIQKHGYPLQTVDMGWSIQVVWKDRKESASDVILIRPVSTYAEDEDCIYWKGIQVILFTQGQQKSKTWWVFRSTEYGNNVHTAIFQKIKELWIPCKHFNLPIIPLPSLYNKCLFQLSTLEIKKVFSLMKT